MKSRILLVLALAAAAADIEASATGWRLEWSDEFETDGMPDPERWRFYQGPSTNNEAQVYTGARRENVFVKDGRLVIRAVREKFADRDYTSARIDTVGKKDFLYGRVEARAKVPTGRGTWPAIWMLGANFEAVGWPACGEIDIMEYVGFQPTIIHSTTHSPRSWAGDFSNGAFELAAPWADFHTYAMEWTPSEIRFFVDSILYHTYENNGGGDYSWPFDKPHNLILNLAIGGNWGGKEGIDDSLFPHSFEIDYVRYFSREESGQQGFPVPSPAEN